MLVSHGSVKNEAILFRPSAEGCGKETGECEARLANSSALRRVINADIKTARLSVRYSNRDSTNGPCELSEGLVCSSLGQAASNFAVKS